MTAWAAMKGANENLSEDTGVRRRRPRTQVEPRTPRAELRDLRLSFVPADAPPVSADRLADTLDILALWFVRRQKASNGGDAEKPLEF